MSVPFLVRRVVNSDYREFTDWIFVVPVQGSYVKSFPTSRSVTPDTCNCASGFDEFGDEVDSGELPGVNSGAFSNSMDFLVITFVGVFFGDHDVEVKDSSSESVGALSDFVGNKLGHFDFLN